MPTPKQTTAQKGTDKVVPLKAADDEIASNVVNELREYIERIESLEEDKAEVARQIASVKKEASHSGVATKILNEIIRERKRMRALGKEKWKAFDKHLRYWAKELGDFYKAPLQISLSFNGSGDADKEEQG